LSALEQIRASRYDLARVASLDNDLKLRCELRAQRIAHLRIAESEQEGSQQATAPEWSGTVSFVRHEETRA
jgi:hypothetical protein